MQIKTQASLTTDDNIDRMVSQGRLILGRWDSLAHYAIVWGLGILSTLPVILAWNQNPVNPTPATMTNKALLIMSGVTVCLATLFYLIQRQRLKLTKETIDLDEYQILEVVNEVGKTFNWLPTTVSKNFVQADIYRIFGTDNRISIIILGKDVFVNSRTLFGDIVGILRENKLTEAFLDALRMRSYEVKFQKEKLQLGSQQNV